MGIIHNLSFVVVVSANLHFFVLICTPLRYFADTALQYFA